MKTFIKLLKILLPSITPFVVFSLIAGNYSDTDGGNGDLMQSLILYYRNMLPLLFIIAVMMQYLIVVPIYHKAHDGDRGRRAILFGAFVLVCIAIATGISYAIWDEPTGAAWLQNSIFTITIIQLAFWLIDILMLVLLSLFQNREPIKENLDT